MKPMEMWTEPVDFMPQPSESFFSTMNEVLETVSDQFKTTKNMAKETKDRFINLMTNAIKSVYGLAILSGSYELMIRALDTIHHFTEITQEEI